MKKLLIPKVFHRIWLGNNPMPTDFISYGETWIEKHPNWEMKLWTDENMMKLQNETFYNNAQSLAQKSDIARLEILYKFGGIYIDCDFECIKNIEQLIYNIEAFAAFESKDIICTAIMGTTSKNSIFKRLIEDMPVSIEKNKNLPINYQTGPFYVTSKLKDKKNITIFNSDLFYPYLWNEKYEKNIKFNKAYAIHHWAGSWL